MNADYEILPFFLSLRADYTVHLPYLFGKSDRLGIEGDLVSLDFAHVKHVVYQSEKMTGGHLNFLNIRMELVGNSLFAFHKA